MHHRGTFFNASISSFQWQASRLASQWIGRPVKRYYILFLFLLSIPVMSWRIESNLRAVIWSDAEGYYQYLPALFIIKDFHKLPPGSVWPYFNDKNEYVDKYTCGIALFELPFFLAAYLLSDLTRYDRMDYFNPVYCRMIALCGLSFAFLGLWFLHKALLKITTPAIVFWVILSVFLGTNLFHYATKEMSISHVYNFFLFSVLLFLLPLYFKNPGWKNSIIIGGLLGWIILIRPTNIIIGLLLILYDVYSWKEFQERIQFYLKNIRSLLCMIPGVIIFFIPQLLYWKEMTGDWFYYSYTEEGFKYWRQPKIAAVLLDVQNGLFLYSPLAIPMILGILLGLRKKNFQAPAAVLIFSIATYIFASWWAWWFGGAFGHRCYVEYYALLAFPLAGLYQHVSRHWKLAPRILFYSSVSVLMIFSVRLSYLYTSIGGPWDGADWRWNWEKYEWILSHLI